MSLFVLLTLVGVASANPDLIKPDQRCINKTLQPSIDFEKIGGIWKQYRFSPNTEYQEMKCYNLEIHKIDKAAKTFHMDSRFELPASMEEVHGLSHDAFIVFDRMAAWGRREKGVPYIGDHVATDYDNYLMFYQCDSNGRATIDIELKDGVEQLPLPIAEEISDLLSQMKVDYNSLKTVDQSTCEYPK